MKLQMPEGRGSIDSAYLEDASGFCGYADRVIVPEDEAGVVAALREASGAGVPVTIAGAGTGLTGGRVPLGAGGGVGQVLNATVGCRCDIDGGGRSRGPDGSACAGSVADTAGLGG